MRPVKGAEIQKIKKPPALGMKMGTAALPTGGE
jgi:hypothetical protein